MHQERHKNRAGIERILWDLQEAGYVTPTAGAPPGAGRGPAVRASRAVARTTVQDSKAIGGLVNLVDRQFTAPEPDHSGRRYLYLDVFWFRVPGDAYRHVLQ